MSQARRVRLSHQAGGPRGAGVVVAACIAAASAGSGPARARAVAGARGGSAHPGARGTLGRHRRGGARCVGGGAGLGGDGGGVEQAGGRTWGAARRARAGAEAAASGSLGLPGFRLFLAGLAARHAAERADQTDEGAAVRAGITLRRPLFISAEAALHSVVLFELRFLHDLKIALLQGAIDVVPHLRRPAAARDTRSHAWWDAGNRAHGAPGRSR